MATTTRIASRPQPRARSSTSAAATAKYPGAIGIDLSAETDADIVADLDEVPWPVDDDSFDQILLQDVIEHLENPLDAPAELHRIGRPGARIHIRTPHFSSVLAYGDATHRHALSVLAIKSFAEPLFPHYTDVRFRLDPRHP